MMNDSNWTGRVPNQPRLAPTFYFSGTGPYNSLGKLMKTRYLIAIATVLAFLYGIAGTLDYADAKADYEHYCKMVEINAWPNYRNIRCD